MILSSSVFWSHTAETVVGWASAGAMGALAGVQHLRDISWDGVADGTAAGAIFGFTVALATLRLQPGNGTASFNRNVVARTEQ